GSEALEAVLEESVVLVLLEVRLEDTSGYEVCRQLRHERGDALPIIFVSEDRTESSDRVAGLLLGADDYLAKPIAPDELVARVPPLPRQGVVADLEAKLAAGDDHGAPADLYPLDRTVPLGGPREERRGTVDLGSLRDLDPLPPLREPVTADMTGERARRRSRR